MSLTQKPVLPKSAMVFAAGLGKRLRPLTDEIPKPLVKVCDKPIIEYSLDKLAQAGVSNVVVNTHHLAGKMHDYLQGYKRLKVKISHESTLLETGGGLVHALPLLGNKDPFFVINGDIICLDGESGNILVRLARYWRPEMNALLLLKRVGDADAIGYDGRGDFDIGYNQQLIKKPAESYPLVYTGIQILHPRLLENMQAEPFSISWLYSKAIQKDGALKGIFGLIHDGPWLHIGTQEGFTLANSFFEKNSQQNPSAGW